jgi:hypothetical protein
MRQVYLALGVMLLAGSGAVFLLRSATEEVMGPGVEQGTKNVEALAAAQNVPLAAAAAPTDAPQAEPDPATAAADDWYAEASPAEEEEDFYGPEEIPAEDEGDFYEPEEPEPPEPADEVPAE